MIHCPSLDTGCLVVSYFRNWAYVVHPVIQCPRAWTVDGPVVSHYGVRYCNDEGYPVSQCPRGEGCCWIFIPVAVVWISKTAAQRAVLDLIVNRGRIMIPLEPRAGHSPSAAGQIKIGRSHV